MTFINVQNESNIGQSGKLQEIPLNKITGSDYPELDSALKGGGDYIDEKDFILFDVMVGNIFLEREKC